MNEAATDSFSEILGNQRGASGPAEEQAAKTEASLTDYESRNCTPDTQRAILIVREASDEALLSCARDEESVAFSELITELGGNLDKGGKTNPRWLANQAATEAYERELIDEQELDWITR